MKLTNLLLLIAIIIGAEFLILTLYMKAPDNIILLHALTSIIIFGLLKLTHSKTKKAITILVNAIPGLGQLGSAAIGGATSALVGFLASSGVKGGVYIKVKGASVTGMGWQ